MSSTGIQCVSSTGANGEGRGEGWTVEAWRTRKCAVSPGQSASPRRGCGCGDQRRDEESGPGEMVVASGAPGQVLGEAEGGLPAATSNRKPASLGAPHPLGTPAPAPPGPQSLDGGWAPPPVLHSKASSWPLCHSQGPHMSSNASVLKVWGALSPSCRSHTRAFCHKDAPRVSRDRCVQWYLEIPVP